MSLLLALVTVICTLPLSALPTAADAYAKGTGTEDDPYIVTEYDNLRRWIAGASANRTIYFKLDDNLVYIQGGPDAADAKTIEIDNGKKIYLDINGHTIRTAQTEDSLPLPYLFRVSGSSSLIIDDIGPKHVNYISCKFISDGKEHNLIRVEDHSSLVINEGRFMKNITTVSMYCATSMPNGAIAADETSEITINGGIIQGANYTLDTRTVDDLPRRDSAIASYGKLTINGGEFIGVVGILGLPDDNDIAVTINGGVFNNCVQVNAKLKVSDTFLPRIAIYGGNFKDRFVVNPGIKGISADTKFYLPILLRGGTFASLVTNDNKSDYSEHDCMAISLYDRTYAKISEAPMIQEALAASLGDSVVYIRYCSDEGKWSPKYQYITRKNTRDEVYVYPNIGTMCDDCGYVRIYPDSFGLKEVLLDNNTVEKPQNIDDGATFSSASVPFYSVSSLGTHTLTFRWYDLPQEMKADGYSYKVTFQTQDVSQFTVPSDSIITTTRTDGTVNEWNYTIPKTHTTTQQTTFRLDLMKDGALVNRTATHNDYLLKYRVEKNTKTVIDNVNLNISAPLVEYDKGSGTVSVSDGAGCTVKTQTVWQGDDEYEDLDNSEYYPAALNTKYYKGITLTAKDGFAFDSNAVPTVNITGLTSNYECYVKVTDESTAVVSLYSNPTERIDEAKGTVTGLRIGNFIRDITIESAVQKKYTFEIKSILRVKDGNTYTTTPGEAITADSNYKICLTANAKWGYAFQEGEPVYDLNNDVYTHSKILLRMETDDNNYFGLDTAYGSIPYNTSATAYISPDLSLAEFGKITGQASSFLDGDATVTIELWKSGSAEADYSTAVSGGTQSGNKYTTAYNFTNIPAGSYTMKVSKANHVTREYTVTVGTGAVTQDVEINLSGDINGDGKVTTLDFGKVNSHARGVSQLTGYELKCADVTGTDGKVTTADAGRINAHARGVSKLWG